MRNFLAIVYSCTVDPQQDLNMLINVTDYWQLMFEFVENQIDSLGKARPNRIFLFFLISLFFKEILVFPTTQLSAER